MAVAFKALNQSEGRMSNPSASSIAFKPLEENKGTDDSYSGGGAMGIPMSAADIEAQRQKSIDVLKGLGQGIANIPIDTINMFRKNPLSRFNFAPQSEESKYAQMAAPFLAPGGIESALSKTTRLIPSLNKLLKSATEGIKGNRITNELGKAVKGGAQVGYINALEHPEDQWSEAGKGFGIGAPMTLATNALTSASPALSMLGKLGIGAGIGYTQGHPVAGAAIASGLPIRGLLGIEPESAISKDMLSGLEPKDVSRSVAANRRLGTSVTPGEASGNYVTAGREGQLKRTEAGARSGFRAEEKQKFEQGKAVNSFLDTIFKPTQKNINNINDLYEKAYEKNVSNASLKEMRDYPIINDAIKTVKNDPAFKHLDPTNYRFLAEVDRALGREYQGNVISNPSAAYNIKQVKNAFNQYLKAKNPLYEEATKAAQPKIVRENFERKMNKEEEDYTAKNVYKSLLNSRKSYRDSLRDLKNFPEAQSILKDMRAGWKNMANMQTTSQGNYTATKGLDHARNFINYAKTFLKNIAGDKSDVARIEHIYGKDWEKGFDKLKDAKNKSEFNRDVISLTTKIATAYGLNDEQARNWVHSMTSD